MISWQKAFEQPATVSGTTLTFAAAKPLRRSPHRGSPLYFGLYAVSTSLPNTTPAPSATASAAPTPIPASPFPRRRFRSSRSARPVRQRSPIRAATGDAQGHAATFTAQVTTTMFPLQ